ncbi:hypothetical protein MCOR27_002098 [Pyricularia oryzae]|uniref:ATP11-domain-containing protein n=1 Tax=Pyricularia grisea TaxID=148305 RepID=A0ABQ8NY56_PYRGI|nr:hypothetical protein MCOR01_002118 [Pyricularia oryzae]KAI6303296.1 hypothetical protein MCOR33_001559 [Pyricularia grisea]KAH9429293.1 hypothetical protein MCOR02_010699 [Pyricularia oryzae]KAI6263737.1 hypothetical protein MCOR19_000070 [Pyricularia oryzae]KAI6285810.1 hypothetical protein MCOR27_002098 [Pyricularia oryzae]
MAAAGLSRAAAPMLRQSISRCRPLQLFKQQRRWAEVHDIRFLTTTRPRQNIAEKYREKLDRKAKSEGLTGIDELKQAYAERIKEQRKAAAAIAPPGLDKILADEPAARATQTVESGANTAGTPTEQSSNSSSKPETTPAKDSSGSQVKPLSAIVDLPKVRQLPVPELTEIWRLLHTTDPKSLCAVVPAPTYKAMEALARQRPQFVLPVPHPEQGAEMHFLQWTFDAATGTSTVLFTQLAEYKNRGEFAQPHTTVTHHPDLADDKGVVLMQGSMVDNRGVKIADAQWLVMCLQRFYGGWDPALSAGGSRLQSEERAKARRELVEWFGTGNENFSIEKLLAEAERLG